MFQHFAICGQSEDDGNWYVLIALKALSKAEAAELLSQYITCHQQDSQYIAYRINDIPPVGFNNYAKKNDTVRCWVSKGAEEVLEQWTVNV
jgi:hypothetical protein